MPETDQANIHVLFPDAGSTDLRLDLAACLFDFSGELRRPAQGKITIPQGSVEMHVPAATAARQLQE